MGVRFARRRTLVFIPGWAFWLMTLGGAVGATLGFVGGAEAALGDCGQPVSDGENPKASDALAILVSAVADTPACPQPAPGLFPPCVCDPSGDGTLTVVDALFSLRAAVGLLDQKLECDCAEDPCGGDSCVFASSVFVTGDMGGLAGADKLCNEAAETADLPGSYRAWLSTELPPVDAIDRIPEVGPWRRTDGRLVAVDRDNLVDGGGLVSAINRNEFGDVFDPPQLVATGTGPDGRFSLPGRNVGFEVFNGTCADWTFGQQSFGDTEWRGGTTSSNTTNWSSCCSKACHLESPIFCFQVTAKTQYCGVGSTQTSIRCADDTACPQSNICNSLSFIGSCVLDLKSCESNADCLPLVCR